MCSMCCMAYFVFQFLYLFRCRNHFFFCISPFSCAPRVKCTYSNGFNGITLRSSKVNAFDAACNVQLHCSKFNETELEIKMTARNMCATNKFSCRKVSVNSTQKKTISIYIKLLRVIFQASAGERKIKQINRL